ncbi:MAG: PASTA domain-containing protein [Bacteroidales bacterium]
MKQSTRKEITITRFLLSRKFWFSLLLAFVLMGLILFGLIKYLEFFTRQGKELVVPDFTGSTLPMIEVVGYSDLFTFLVVDSVYDESQLPGSVIIQNPIPGTRVKKGRRIYFTLVASTPEMVMMPDLRDLTLRQALNVLEMSKLKTGKLIYQPSFDKNAVLAQFYMEDTVAPGDTLVKGSTIDLIIGSGERRYMIPIPFLIGKTREEAIFELNMASFNLGVEFYLDTVPAGQMRVYLQEPMWDSELRSYPGDSIHLWYRSDMQFDFESYLNTMKSDSSSIVDEESEQIFDF